MKAIEAQEIATQNLLPSLEPIRQDEMYLEVISKIKREAEKGRYDYLSNYLRADMRELLCYDGFKIKECNLGNQFYITWEPDWYKIV